MEISHGYDVNQMGQKDYVEDAKIIYLDHSDGYSKGRFQIL
jgi:hypothetical protein